MPYIRYFVVFACLILALHSTAEEDALMLRLDDADIRELVRWASEHTDKNIILHPSVSGKVTVLAGAPLTKDQAYATFLSILEVHGFAVVESDQAVKVLPAQMATSQYAPLSAGTEKRSADDLTTRVVPMVHLPPAQVEQVLKPLLSPSAWVKAIADTNLVLLADREARIDRAMTLLRQVDKPNPYEVRVLPLRYAKAESIVGHAQALLPQLYTGTPTLGKPTLRADNRTNALLVSGPPLYVEQTSMLVQRLDRPSEEESSTHVIPVQYLAAGELVEPLNLLANSLETNSSSKRGDAQNIIISRNETHNALIITAPERHFRQMADLVEQLDVPRAQVLVEAAIVEMSADRALNLGVEWRWFDEDDGFFGGSSTPGQLPIPDGPDYGGGFTFGWFYQDEFWMVVRALAGDANSNLLSTPTIVALDNQPAAILVGENVPFVTGSATSGSSPTTNPFQTIERQDIGISLKIKPHINNNDSITLEIEQTVEQIAPTATAETADIVTNKREISTTVLIEDDEILVLGGLIRDDVSEVHSKVPLLGDIPVLGNAFKSTTTQVTKRNLMVFIHPRILRHRGDKKIVTDTYMERAEGLKELTEEVDFVLFPTLDVTEDSSEAPPDPSAPDSFSESGFNWDDDD